MYSQVNHNVVMFYIILANWSRKYDGSIRPRTGLVFVEPRVYDQLIEEEKGPINGDSGQL